MSRGIGIGGIVSQIGVMSGVRGDAVNKKDLIKKLRTRFDASEEEVQFTFDYAERCGAIRFEGDTVIVQDRDNEPPLAIVHRYKFDNLVEYLRLAKKGDFGWIPKYENKLTTNALPQDKCPILKGHYQALLDQVVSLIGYEALNRLIDASTSIDDRIQSFKKDFYEELLEEDGFKKVIVNGIECFQKTTK